VDEIAVERGSEDVTPQRWSRIRELFGTALETPESEQRQFLEAACGGDTNLRAEVERLLAGNQEPSLQSPVATLFPAAVEFVPGDAVAHYRIGDKLGAGGMGVVYRARDIKLDRDVAIKLLPSAVSQDPERLARFAREAKVLASLNHPNIAAIHGLEEAVGKRFLVLELVEGETLAQRIAKGPVPVDEALNVCRQIAEGLEAAHEKGIIHRDLKPANVKLTPEGNVKVLDFGLATTFQEEIAAADPSHSPTITQKMTRPGVILGTAAYMSPEQARGRHVDKRADIWAFGVVVFEMLTGNRLFSGETISDTLASVLKTDPPWTTLPAAVPPDLRRLLRQCLEKDVKRRLQAIGDARIQVEDLLSGASGESVEATISPPLRFWQRWQPWAGVTGTLIIALALVLWAPWRKTIQSSASLLSVYLGADVSLVNQANSSDAILSPDGTMLAFVARKEGGSAQIHLRPLNRAQATTLSGTEGAYSPFFSPDGQWIAFFSGGKLKKIGVSEGAVVTLCDAPAARGGAWADDGTIVLSPDVGAVPNVTLQRVSSVGGKAETLTSLAEGEATQRYPQVLPGGHSVLFTSSSTIGAFDDANLVVVTLPTRTRKIVQRGGYQGRYVSSGHLVYIHEGTLFAAPFDLGRLEVTGRPVPVLEGVRSNALSGGAELSVSASGTLVYVPGQSTSGRSPIHWLGRNGKTILLRAAPANWSNLQFAPDGRRLALEIVEGQDDIWVYEWERDTLTRLTSDPASHRKPAWTPDGRRIAFASTRADPSTPNLYWQRADGTGEAQRLTESKNLQLPGSWHPSGKVLAYEEQNPQTSYDLMLLPMGGDDISGWKPGPPAVFLRTAFAEREPAFSPDGRWLAYSSNETGRQEVYVRPFPGPGGKWQISTGGGSFPTWSLTKHELLYENEYETRVMVAPFAVEGDSFRAEKPWPWPNGRYEARGSNRMFDLHPDGERLALRPATQTPTDAKQDHVTFIFNFFDELRRRVPVTK
jgi:serine/threonine protein kinase